MTQTEQAMSNFMEFAGPDMQNLTHENFWDLITILSAELSTSAKVNQVDNAGNLVRMDETRRALNISWDAVVEHCLEIFDGINRKECKHLIAVLTLQAQSIDAL